MVDPGTALPAVAIADLFFRKFVESGAGELAKKFTEPAVQKMGELWQRVKDRLSGKSTKLDEALTKVEQGDGAALDTVTKYLDKEMKNYPEFAAEIRLLAREINVGEIQDNSSIVMEVSGYQATGTQIKNEVTNQGGENYTGNITINKYSTPPN